MTSIVEPESVRGTVVPLEDADQFLPVAQAKHQWAGLLHLTEIPERLPVGELGWRGRAHARLAGRGAGGERRLT